ncbi:MAG: nicotinate-nucleotide--dimethylbenzimidazole phosphoribosyltransferase [Candidatus Adiutrix sp.]|jgi:nicotinate-nucleotide--dimethylbenzimidazole phosphoribosyltransferase|nr:nicotinate-nucleotide--dimethylbenzimidazole phosphoribosyltransferase [Candidatus Adiutrix sp.]
MNYEEQLREHLKQIGPINRALADYAREREDALAKPRRTLGRLEDCAVRLAAIQNRRRPGYEHRLIVVCAADHGVVEEGVSPYPQDVTRQQIANFSQGGGTITVLGRHARAKVLLADVGVNYDFPENPGILDCKIAYGTRNMAKGPAMSREEALRSILAGIDIVLNEPAVELAAAGEMGIGNTTPSSAICSLLTGLTPEEATGVGSGLDPAKLAHKAEVIRRSIEINKPDPDDAIDVLAKIGGLEIGAMCGVYLGAAMRRSAVIIDGFIAGAAALLAAKLAPALRDYFFAGHCSREKAHRATLEYLGLEPLLDLGLWLGEGSGAAVSMFILECAAAHFNEMRTLEEAMVCDTLEQEKAKASRKDK